MAIRFLINEPEITAQEVDIINRYRRETEANREAVKRILCISERPKWPQRARRSGRKITQGQLFVNDAGLFQIDDRELYEGDELQVLIIDGRDNYEKWVDTFVCESEDGGLSLAGLFGYQPEGLFARTKE